MFVLKRSLLQVFSWEFCEILQKTFFTVYLLANTVMGYSISSIKMLPSSYLISKTAAIGGQNLTDSFPMHPFYTPWKHKKPYGFQMFSGGRERVHWKQMG